MDNLVRAIRPSFQRRKLGPFWVSYPAPLQIPDPLKKWPESTGIGGRFETEWVAGLKRNHCPLSTGIYIPGFPRLFDRGANDPADMLLFGTAVLVMVSPADIDPEPAVPRLEDVFVGSHVPSALIYFLLLRMQIIELFYILSNSIMFNLYQHVKWQVDSRGAKVLLIEPE
jgi:hypothetical protein